MTNMSAEQLHALKQQALSLLRGNRLDEAKALFSQVSEQNAEDVDAWYLLSCIHGMQGNMDEAGHCCRRVIALRPDHSDAHVNLGNVLLFQGKADEAVQHYQAALRFNPNNAGALCGLGNTQSSLGNHDEAILHYKAAVRLNPNFVEAYYNLGNSQIAQRKYDDAIKSFRQAIRLNPNYAAAYNNIGNAYKELDEITAALENYRTAISLQPNFATAHNNLAIVLKEQGLLTEAFQAALQALQVQPDFTDAYISLGNISIAQGQPDVAIGYLQQLLKIRPNHPEAHSCLFTMMHYRPEYSPQHLFEVAQEWGIRYIPENLYSSSPVSSLDPMRRLRIGYVSGDFYNHPVGYFLESILNHHDGLHYETFCYYNHNKHDELTARLQQSAHHWRNITGLSDQSVLQQIRSDKIDILIDLSGHTDRNRLLVFAHKPAPIQITWLGYFDTTGLRTIDYIIGDRFLIPPAEEACYVENVYRLPNAYLCYSPPQDDIEPGSLPALSTGQVTFGCFNNPSKLTEKVIACWSKLLLNLPQAQLYLKYKAFGDDGVRKRYQEIFSRNGVDLSRVRFAGASPRQQYLATYQEIDIGLDPFPFNGCTTTMESLWMGVPVITLRGDRYVGHMGETILKHLGLEENITDSEEAYIDRAISLASNLPALNEIRGNLRSKLITSPLCDGAGFTQCLETAYRNIWVDRCKEP